MPERNPRAGEAGSSEASSLRKSSLLPEMSRSRQIILCQQGSADRSLRAGTRPGAEAHSPSPPPGSTLSPSQPWPLTSVLHTCPRRPRDRQSQPRVSLPLGPVTLVCLSTSRARQLSVPLRGHHAFLLLQEPACPLSGAVGLSSAQLPPVPLLHQPHLGRQEAALLVNEMSVHQRDEQHRWQAC